MRSLTHRFPSTMPLAQFFTTSMFESYECFGNEVVADMLSKSGLADIESFAGSGWSPVTKSEPQSPLKSFLGASIPVPEYADH